MRSVAALIAGWTALVSVPATAQAYQCRIPQSPVSVPTIERDAPVREMPVTGYTLALSWSPEFCRLRDDEPRHARQCSGRAGRFAFVVHGLWPNGPNGSWPQWCPTRREPAAQDMAQAMCMSPDPSLVARQWAKHGACMTPDPGTYLRITQILWNSLRWPDFDRLSRQRDLTAGDIRQTFADANPYWEAEDVGLVLNQRGWLREMRLCYGADFMPRRCDPRRYGPDDDEAVRIWRGL